MEVTSDDAPLNAYTACDNRNHLALWVVTSFVYKLPVTDTLDELRKSTPPGAGDV